MKGQKKEGQVSRCFDVIVQKALRKPVAAAYTGSSNDVLLRWRYHHSSEVKNVFPHRRQVFAARYFRQLFGPAPITNTTIDHGRSGSGVANGGGCDFVSPACAGTAGPAAGMAFPKVVAEAD